MGKYIILGVFIAVLVSVGVYSRRRTGTVDDFFIGSRTVGAWLSAFAYGTAYFSAVLFVGYAGKVGYGFGLSSLWICIGNAFLGTMLAWWLLAKRTRNMTGRLSALTMPEFLARRYGSKAIKIFSALLIFVFLIPYSASVYTGLAYLFDSTFHINYTTALWTMATLTAVYLVVGGYMAVARNDAIQGVVMIVGVIVMVWCVVHSSEVGGLSNGLKHLHDIDPSLTAVWPGWHFEGSGFTAFLNSPGVELLGLVLLTSLGALAHPKMVHKFYAMKDDGVVRRAIVISTVFAFLMTFGAYFTGSLSHLFPQVAPLAANKQWDQIMPTVINVALPSTLVVLVLLLVLSASMSTLASLVMVSASVVSVDFIRDEIRPDLSKTAVVTMMRVLVVAFILLSVILAQAKIAIIITMMAISWGVVSGAFLGPFIWGLYWRRVGKAAAWAGMVVGVGFTLLVGWHYAWDAKYMPVIASIAMLGSLAVVPLVALVTKPASDECIAAAFGDTLEGALAAARLEGIEVAGAPHEAPAGGAGTAAPEPALDAETV
ncbi:MAG TPA: sodium/solute symporter [Thermoleophilia bacterium]|nr:sodium/solute symporter [Thermoleophilia bacterium]